MASLGSKSYDLGSTYGLRSDIDLDYRLRNATVGPMHITTTGASAADSTSRRLPKAVPGPLLVATAQHLRTAVAWPAACCAAVPTAQLNPIAAAAAPWGQPERGYASRGGYPQMPPTLAGFGLLPQAQALPVAAVVGLPSSGWVVSRLPSAPAPPLASVTVAQRSPRSQQRHVQKMDEQRRRRRAKASKAKADAATAAATSTALIPSAAEANAAAATAAATSTALIPSAAEANAAAATAATSTALVPSSQNNSSPPTAPPADPTVPSKPLAGEVWSGPLPKALQMFESEQFPSPHTESFSVMLEDMVSIFDSVCAPRAEGRARHAEDWLAIVGNPPTEAQSFEHVPMVETCARSVVVSLREHISRGPEKGSFDVAITFIDSGLRVPPEMVERLHTAAEFLARYFKDPGRGQEHDEWGAGDHRMCGRRGNPLDRGVNNYSPVERALLNDPEWCAAEKGAHEAFDSWLQFMHSELRRVCPTAARGLSVPRNHTHSFALPSRVGGFNAPQTTAGIALNCPAFSNHSDRNCGFFSPFTHATPKRLRRRQSPPAEAAAMQFVNALAYKAIPIASEDGSAPTHFFQSDCKHAYRPKVSLITTAYADYVKGAGTQCQEQRQRAAWLAARDEARREATDELLATRAGMAMSEAELELQVQLQCGVLPMAGLVQEGCIARMKTMQGDTRHAASVAMPRPPAAKRKPAGPPPPVGLPPLRSARLRGEQPGEGLSRKTRSSSLPR